jgi:hypothetical protein
VDLRQARPALLQVQRAVSCALEHARGNTVAFSFQQAQRPSRRGRRSLAPAMNEYIAELWCDNCSLYDDEVQRLVQNKFGRPVRLNLIKSHKRAAGLARKVVGAFFPLFSEGQLT